MPGAGVRSYVALMLVTAAGSAWGQAVGVGGEGEAGKPCDGCAITGCGKAEAVRRQYQAARMLGLSPSVVDEAWRRRLAGAGEGSARGPLRGPGSDAPEDTDVLHNFIDIEVFPAREEIAGSNTMTVRALRDGLATFTVRLRGNFSASATINGTTPVAIAMPSSDSTYGRVVLLDRPYNAGEEFTLRIDYSGPVVSRGLGSFVFASQEDAPVFASLSEPYYAATWWPCKDGDVLLPGDNADKATFDIAVTAPADLRSVANGLLVSEETLPGSRKRHHWRTEYPTSTYLAAIAATNYTTWTLNYEYIRDDGTPAAMPVEFNFYPASDTPGNRAAAARVLPMLDVFGEIFGQYPFIEEKYGIYQFPFNGGMEHQTNSGQSSFGESLTAHELAHQWWGDDVTCRRWNDLWLNEGFATYAEALWAERRPGSSGAEALREAMLARLPSNVNGTVYIPDADTASMGRLFSANLTYRKAAWVVHALRGVMGDEAFFGLLAQYRAAFSGGAATTADFTALASDVAGSDLSWFFDQWLYSPGAPEYEYGWQNAFIDGRPYVRVCIRQVQDPAYPVFTMPLGMRFAGTFGSFDATVWNSADWQHYLIPAGGPVGTVQLDPDWWVLATGKEESPYVPGPPKVVSLNPAPGAAVEAGSDITVRAVFSDPIAGDAAAVNIERIEAGGTVGASPVPFAFAMGLGQGSVELGLGVLPPGEYRVTLTDGLRSLTGGFELDGELDAGLPSGDGVAGGPLVYTFTVVGACAADINGDSEVTAADITAFLSGWFGDRASGGLSSDVSGDGAVDGADITAFLASWFAARAGGC